MEKCLISSFVPDLEDTGGNKILRWNSIINYNQINFEDGGDVGMDIYYLHFPAVFICDSVYVQGCAQ